MDKITAILSLSPSLCHKFSLFQMHNDRQVKWPKEQHDSTCAAAWCLHTLVKTIISMAWISMGCLLEHEFSNILLSANQRRKTPNITEPRLCILSLYKLSSNTPLKCLPMGNQKDFLSLSTHISHTDSTFLYFLINHNQIHLTYEQTSLLYLFQSLYLSQNCSCYFFKAVSFSSRRLSTVI